MSTTEERNDNLDAAEHDTENATEQQTPRRRGRLKRGTQEAFTRKLAHLLDIGAKIEIIGTQVINDGNDLVLLIDYDGYEFRLGVKEPWLVDGDLEKAFARRQGLRGRYNRVKNVERLSVEELKERNLPLYWNEEWLRAELARLGSYAEIAREHGYPNASTIASYAYRKFGITILKDYDAKRKAAIQDWKKGRWTYLEIARRHGVGVATVYRWVADYKRRQAEGETADDERRATT